jgi:hypothetical protein
MCNSTFYVCIDGPDRRASMELETDFDEVEITAME